MSCKPKAKSLRASNGVELMNRFAKNQPVIRAEDGLESMGTRIQDQVGSGQVADMPVAPTTGAFSADRKATARGMSTGGFNMAMPTGLQLRDGGELHLQSGGPDIGGHRGLFDTMGSALDDWGITTPELVPGVPTTWSSGAPISYSPPRVTMAQPAAPAQIAPSTGYSQHQGYHPSAPSPAAPTTNYGQHQGFGATPAVPAQPAAPATPSLRANAFGDNTSFNSSFNPARSNHGNVSMQEWSAPGRSNGQPNAQDMGAADGFAQRDAAKLAQVRSSGSLVTPAQSSMPNYSGAASGLAPIPGGKAPMNNFSMKHGGEIHAADGYVSVMDRVPDMANPAYRAYLEQHQALEGSHPELLLGQGARAGIQAVKEARALMAARQAAPSPVTEGMIGQYADNPFYPLNHPSVPPQMSTAGSLAKAGAGSIVQSVKNARGVVGWNLGAQDNDPKAGLRNGGGLRTGQGGVVPGTGTGDKIPAKYEPGEFVVSNDMLNAQPALRGHLRELRAEVLANKGMTPAMADAKAVGGKGLRAVNAFGDFYDDMGEPLGQQAASPGAAGPRGPVAPPNSGPPNAPGGYRTGQKLAGALRGTMGRAVPVLSGAYNLATGMDEGDGWKMAKGAGDMAAGAALGTPAAPLAAGYLGLRGAYEGAKALAPVVSDYFMKDRDAAVANTLGPKAVAPTGVSAPGAAQPQNFDAANKAKMDAFAAENPTGLAKLNDTRNIDNEAGTMDVFTRANSDKPGWTTVSTPEAKARRLREADDWKQEQTNNAIQHRADLDRQNAYFGAQNAGDRYAGLPIKTAAALRVADAQAASQMAQAQLQANTNLRTTGMNDDTSLRTTAMNNNASLMSNKMTNAFNNYKFGIEQGNNQRDYNRNVSNDQFSQREAGDKAFTEQANSLFQTKDKDGKVVPDTQKAAAYTSSVSDTIGHIIQKYSNSPNPQDRAYARDLNQRGPAALDAADRAVLPMLFERQQLHANTIGAGPFSSGGGTSRNLLDYADAPGNAETSTGLQQRRRLVGGQQIPESNLRYGAEANHFLPNWGSGSNYLGAK